jgi:membrane-associated protease RseP (regulator of RpoE activity)
MSRQHNCFQFSPLLLLVGFSVSFTLLGGAAAYAQNDAAAATESEDETSAASSATGDESDDPNLVTYPENEEPNEVPGDNTIKPQPVSPARKQALQRRAGEQVGDSPRGRAVVLGMHIQEADNERAKVVEVAPASPAFDAGIRKGDEIVSFDGFKATTYRDWIDGMRRLAADVPDGDTVPIVLMRGGERLNLRLRIPVAKAGAVPEVQDPTTLNQTIVPTPAAPSGVAVQQQPRWPFGVGGGSGGDTLIADQLGEDFNSPTGDNAGRAVAEIFRLDTVPPPIPVAAPNARAATTANGRTTNRAAARGVAGNSTPTINDTAGARVGLAGFRNDANGMFVMLDVGGLQPGNYLVGIDDPGLLAMGGNTDAPRPRANSARRHSGSIGTPAVTPVEPQPPTRPPKVPDRGATPSSQPQSPQPASPAGSAPQSQLEIPRTVLAQVADAPADSAPAGGSPTGGAAPTTVPGAGQPQPGTPVAGGSPLPIDLPPVGPVNRPPVNPTGGSRRSQEQVDPNVANQTAGQANLAGTSVGPAMPIGTLAVDESGVGRLQQIVESVSVQDVVGQAIVIYAQNNMPQPAPPATPNANADVRSGVGATAAGRLEAGGLRAAQSPARGTTATGTQPTAAPAAGADTLTTGTNRGNATRPVAGGVIRLLADDGSSTANANTTAGDSADQNVSTSSSSNNVQQVPQSSAAQGTGQTEVR